MIMLACTKSGQNFKAKVIEHSPKHFVANIENEEQDLNTLPTIRIENPKCRNNAVNVWQVQTRDSDESSTQFLRCGFTHREYT
jgi:transcription factor S